MSVPSPAAAAAAVPSVLDDPVGASLRGAHAHLARTHGRAVSYDAAVASFSAVPVDAQPADWSDLATLLGPGALADLFHAPPAPPVDWAPVFEMAGQQLVLDGALADLPGLDDAEPVPTDLGDGDVPEMLDLAERTRPGPFWPRTIEMGRYVGVHDRGRLVAMAGERLHPPGWTEISAVCVDAEARGRGLGARVVHEVARGVLTRGDAAFLHVIAGNPAVGLYQRLGFRVRREVTFRGCTTPGAAP